MHDLMIRTPICITHLRCSIFRISTYKKYCAYPLHCFFVLNSTSDGICLLSYVFESSLTFTILSIALHHYLQYIVINSIFSLPQSNEIEDANSLKFPFILHSQLLIVHGIVLFISTTLYLINTSCCLGYLQIVIAWL